MYLILDEKNIACLLLFEKPSENVNFVEIETEEEGLKYLGKIWTGKEFVEQLTYEENKTLNIKCELEYIKCLLEVNNGI